MERVTAEDVKAIMDNCPLEDDEIEVYIVAANRLVTRVFSGDTVMNDDDLKEIERYFAAHMIASTRYRMGSTEKVGEVQITYTGKWGEGIKSTPYGQMVLQLDITGKMSVLGTAAASLVAIRSFKHQRKYWQ